MAGTPGPSARRIPLHHRGALQDPHEPRLHRQDHPHAPAPGGGGGARSVLENLSPATRASLRDAALQLEAGADPSTVDPAIRELLESLGSSGVLPPPEARDADLTYDWKNRLIAYHDRATGQTHRYHYDALGRRILKRVDADSPGAVDRTTRFVYGGPAHHQHWQVLEEQKVVNNAWVPKTVFAYGSGIDEAVFVWRAPGEVGGGPPEGPGRAYFLVSDELSLGNVSLALDAGSGNPGGTPGLGVVERYRYGDYGAVTILEPDGSVRASGESLFGNTRFFTGRELDSEIPGGGLYHYRHRSYDPSLGRFISRDPLGIWGDPNNLGNPLAYVGMMPWGYSDPYGLEAVSWLEIGAQLPRAVGQHAAARWGPMKAGFAGGAISGGAVGAVVGTAALGVGTLPGAGIGATAAGLGGALSAWFDDGTSEDAFYAGLEDGPTNAALGVAGASISTIRKLDDAAECITASTAGAAKNTIPAQLRAGISYEAERLAQLGSAKNTITWRPTFTDVDSSAFKVIVGEAKYTASGVPKGTIFDVTQGGLREIKSGTSILNSSYQLRLQTYYSVKNNLPYTIETARQVNPTFQSYLGRWGVQVAAPR